MNLKEAISKMKMLEIKYRNYIEEAKKHFKENDIDECRKSMDRALAVKVDINNFEKMKLK